MTAATAFATIHLARGTVPVSPAPHHHGHYTVWSVVGAVVFLIVVLGAQLYRRSRRR